MTQEETVSSCMYLIYPLSLKLNVKTPQWYFGYIADRSLVG